MKQYYHSICFSANHSHGFIVAADPRSISFFGSYYIPWACFGGQGIVHSTLFQEEGRARAHCKMSVAADFWVNWGGVGKRLSRLTTQAARIQGPAKQPSYALG